MTIFVTLFGLMLIISTVIILCAIQVSSHADAKWDEWTDVEEFERSLRDQSTPSSKPRPSSHENDQNNHNITHIETHTPRRS